MEYTTNEFSQAELEDLQTKIPEFKDSTWKLYEGYVYFVPPKGGLARLYKVRRDGEELCTLYDTKSRQKYIHEHCYFMLKLLEVSDGYVHIEISRHDRPNDYTHEKSKNISKVKIDGTKRLNVMYYSSDSNPGGEESYTDYYDDEGNFIRREEFKD